MIKKAKTIEEVYAAFEPYPLNEKKQINDFFVDGYNNIFTINVKIKIATPKLPTRLFMNLKIKYNGFVNMYNAPKSTILSNKGIFNSF